MPLARFAHAWVRAFADQPGWAPPKPRRAEFDDPIAPATDPGDRMLRQMGTPAFLMGRCDQPRNRRPRGVGRKSAYVSPAQR